VSDKERGEQRETKGGKERGGVSERREREGDVGIEINREGSCREASREIVCVCERERERNGRVVM
jgi:hypothetical protein